MEPALLSCEHAARLRSLRKDLIGWWVDQERPNASWYARVPEWAVSRFPLAVEKPTSPIASVQAGLHAARFLEISESADARGI